MDDPRNLKRLVLTEILFGVLKWILILVFITSAALYALTFTVRPSKRSQYSRVQADMRSIQVAIESYYFDEKSYPAWHYGVRGANTKLDPEHPSYQTPTFMVKTSTADPFHTLTTPIQYMSVYIKDPFAKYKGINGIYAYWAGDCKQGWIVYSIGPDLDYDINPEQDYTPGKPASDALISKSYDPTNGTKSSGDILTIKDPDQPGQKRSWP